MTFVSPIQPVDQGAISSFKTCYLKKKYDMLCKAVDDKGMSVKEFWKKLSIRDAVILIGEVWAAITHLLMNTIWRSVCPVLLHDFKTVHCR
jgi:hypothetical protein